MSQQCSNGRDIRSIPDQTLFISYAPSSLVAVYRNSARRSYSSPTLGTYTLSLGPTHQREVQAQLLRSDDIHVDTVIDMRYNNEMV